MNAFSPSTADALVGSTALSTINPAAAAGSDAELLAIGREADGMIEHYESIIAAWAVLPVHHPDFERLADASLAPADRLYKLSDRALEIPADAHEACLVKARLLHHEILATNRVFGQQELSFGTKADELAWSLCGDLLRPRFNPDTALLALRPEYARLHALMVEYNKGVGPDDDTIGADWDTFCLRITRMPPAVTPVGRAFKAAAAMHQLLRLADSRQADIEADNADGPECAAWWVLKEIAGNAYQPVWGGE